MGWCLRAWALKVHKSAFEPESASSTPHSGPWFLHLWSKGHNTNCPMELFLFFPNLNLFSYEKQLSSASLKTNHSQKTIRVSILDLTIQSKKKQSAVGEGLGLGIGTLESVLVLLLEFFLEAQWCPERVLSAKVRPMECTNHRILIRHRLASVDGTWKPTRNSPINLSAFVKYVSFCRSWWILNELCHHEQVS